MAHYSDDQAKDILRDSQYWRTRTQKWGVAKPVEYWIRCRPSDAKTDKRPLPTLCLPGANLFQTQPDGMWIYFRGTSCVDVLAIEVCGTMQNLSDKRSRFLSTGTGLMLAVPATWLHRPIALKKGAKASQTRAQASGCLQGAVLPKKGKMHIPVRFLRVLFVIPDTKYKSWMANHVPAGHEFFIKHNSLKSMNSKPGQKFLGAMTFQAHFCTRS